MSKPTKKQVGTAALIVCRAAVPEASNELLGHLARRYIEDYYFRCDVDRLAHHVRIPAKEERKVDEAKAIARMGLGI